MSYPVQRLRRLRLRPELRTLIREHHLSPSDVIYPLFVSSGRGEKMPIASMPGIYQISVDLLGQEVREVFSLGIPGVILFGIPERKDSKASAAYAHD